MDDMPHCAKFRQNRSVHRRDIVIFIKCHDFSIFQTLLPSWICLGRICATHKWYFVTFITVQNLIVIDAVISIRWKF